MTAIAADAAVERDPSFDRRRRTADRVSRRRILGTLKMHNRSERADTTIAEVVPLHRNVQISNIAECEIDKVFAVFLAQMGKNCLQLRYEKW